MWPSVRDAELSDLCWPGPTCWREILIYTIGRRLGVFYSACFNMKLLMAMNCPLLQCKPADNLAFSDY